MVTVLVVDDEEQVRRAVTRVLVRHGYTVEEAATVHEARTVLAALDVDIVVCDVMMPGTSGIELLRQVVVELPDTAVFMLSGIDNPEVAREALELGATAYLLKPFVPNEILINVANSLRLRDLRRQRRTETDALERKLTDRTAALRGALRDLDETGSPALPSDYGTVDRLAAALSLRDDETGRHIERMSRYTAILAKERGMDGWLIDAVRMASMLHDVGKIGIPDGILLKPGPLTDDEFEVVKRHPELGYQLLIDGDSQVLRLGATIALTHHERWDGTGYPRQLAGEEIPLEGRLAAVADVFDALTSNRVYRPALDVVAAIELVREQRERHFDPEVVDLFLRVIDQVLAVLDALSDPVQARPIGVVLVDDHRMFAESVSRLLARERGILLLEIADTVATGLDAVDRHRPDVVLMDVGLPDGDGISATREIRSRLPTTKVVLLTGHTEDSILLRGIEAGCCGFLTKDQAFDKVAEAVREASTGDSVMPAGRMLSLLACLDRDRHRDTATLTDQETRVIGLAARGLRNEAIAERLALSPPAVRGHMDQAMAKLGAHSRLEVVASAVRRGIVTVP